MGLVIICSEFILWGAYRITLDRRLDTTIPSANGCFGSTGYYFKIAIFGGSSAAGYNAERGFAEILKYELGKRYPNQRFCIKNYARSGQPFHRHQAEILKAVIDKYDVFLIYSGNNEAWNYWDDVGHFRKAQFKHKKQYVPPAILGSEVAFDGKPLWALFLEANSRLYAIAWKFKSKYIPPIFGKSSELDMLDEIHYGEIEKQRNFPATEVTRMIINYKKDLEDIARLARIRGKAVIVSSVPTNETWKPFFSVHRPGITVEELSAFDQYYASGRSSYAAGKYVDAIRYFSLAEAIDDQVAILHYMLGVAHVRTGAIRQGQAHLMKSIDNDGFPVRAMTSLHQVLISTSRTYENVYFVDSLRTFHDLLEKGLTYDDLFSDVQHPSMLGHAVIANGFLCRLSELELLRTIARYSQKVWK